MPYGKEIHNLKKKFILWKSRKLNCKNMLEYGQTRYEKRLYPFPGISYTGTHQQKCVGVVCLIEVARHLFGVSGKKRA